MLSQAKEKEMSSALSTFKNVIAFPALGDGSAMDWEPVKQEVEGVDQWAVRCFNPVNKRSKVD